MTLGGVTQLVPTWSWKSSRFINNSPTLKKSSTIKGPINQRLIVSNLQNQSVTDRQAGQLLQPSHACALRVNKQTKQQQKQQKTTTTTNQPTLFVEKNYKLTVYQSQIHIMTYKTCNYLYEVIRLAFGKGHQYYTELCQVAYGLSGSHGSYDLS